MERALRALRVCVAQACASEVRSALRTVEGSRPREVTARHVEEPQTTGTARARRPFGIRESPLFRRCHTRARKRFPRYTLSAASAKACPHTTETRASTRSNERDPGSARERERERESEGTLPPSRTV